MQIKLAICLMMMATHLALFAESHQSPNESTKRSEAPSSEQMLLQSLEKTLADKRQELEADKKILSDLNEEISKAKTYAGYGGLITGGGAFLVVASLANRYKVNSGMLNSGLAIAGAGTVMAGYNLSEAYVILKAKLTEIEEVINKKQLELKARESGLEDYKRSKNLR